MNKGIFKLGVEDLTKNNLKEWLDNPETYGDMVNQFIRHLIYKVDEYSPDGIGFEYSDEFMEVII